MNDKILNAQNKLQEIIKKLEEDNLKLKELIAEKGFLMAESLLENNEKNATKIKVLTASIEALKINVNESYPAICVGLKSKIDTLLIEDEAKSKRDLEVEQLNFEEEISAASKKLIPALKNCVALNQTIQNNWALWTKVSEKTGRTNLSGKFKCSMGSQEMLNFVASILQQEWDGVKVPRAQFYDKLKL